MPRMSAGYWTFTGGKILETVGRRVEREMGTHREGERKIDLTRAPSEKRGKGLQHSSIAERGGEARDSARKKIPGPTLQERKKKELPRLACGVSTCRRGNGKKRSPAREGTRVGMPSHGKKKPPQPLASKQGPIR